MKKFAALLLIAIFPFSAHAGRMPDTVESVTAVGNGYVKLNISSNSPEAEYDYHIVNAIDIKRLVGGSGKKECYIFYFTGMETLKIHVSNQACSAVVKELIVAQQ